MKKQTATRKGWKAVSIHKGGKLKSLINVTNSVRRVEYKKDEWAKPRRGQGPLAVFKTFRHAESFVQTQICWTDVVIVRCEYVPSKEDRLWLVPSKPRDSFERKLDEMPKGSALASAVRLGDRSSRVFVGIHSVL